jgi:hypothetical protein
MDAGKTLDLRWFAKQYKHLQRRDEIGLSRHLILDLFTAHRAEKSKNQGDKTPAYSRS